MNTAVIAPPRPWALAQARTAASVAALVRVVLGVLWLHEGIVKYHAGFGKADILLVVNSTATNSRVPHFYSMFTADVLGKAPALFGIVVPLIEVGLGAALVLGIFTLPVALISVAQLCNYWFADQLITQYPIMIALSALAIAFAPSAQRYSLTSVVMKVRNLQPPAALRRWL